MVLQPLAPAEILSLEGADAVAFAHAQFTTAVRDLTEGEWQWSASLDPQGRVRAFFALLRVAPDRLLAWLPLGDASALAETLKRYVFRSKVRLELRPGCWLHRLEQLEPDSNGARFGHIADGFVLAFPDGRVAALAPADSDHADAAALAVWQRADVAARLPLIPPGAAGEFVPQALDLERFGAIRFDKGCYPGQEIAARLHFRGGNKRHPHRIRSCATTLTPGQPLVDAQGATVGHVVHAAPAEDSAGCDALAVILDTPEPPSQLAASGGEIIQRID